MNKWAVQGFFWVSNKRSTNHKQPVTWNSSPNINSFMKIAPSQIDKLSKEMRRSICFNILTPKAQTTTKSTGNKDNRTTITTSSSTTTTKTTANFTTFQRRCSDKICIDMVSSDNTIIRTLFDHWGDANFVSIFFFFFFFFFFFSSVQMTIVMVNAWSDIYNAPPLSLCLSFSLSLSLSLNLSLFKVILKLNNWFLGKRFYNKLWWAYMYILK